MWFRGYVALIDGGRPLGLAIPAGMEQVPTRSRPGLQRSDQADRQPEISHGGAAIAVSSRSERSSTLIDSAYRTLDLPPGK